MLRRLVNVVEVLALVAVGVFVIMLFANEPSTPAAARSPGEQLFRANCASCHGADGRGGFGPQLAGGVAVRDFPNENDQIAFVAKGRGSMPAFAGVLTPAQIRQVVDYTRTGLGK
jgi:mono/diheme cytochrome c family protein